MRDAVYKYFGFPDSHRAAVVRGIVNRWLVSGLLPRDGDTSFPDLKLRQLCRGQTTVYAVSHRTTGVRIASVYFYPVENNRIEVMWLGSDEEEVFQKA